jgi:hypothetical protein
VAFISTFISVPLADETVQINGYGAARQLTLFEDGAPVLHVLTSDTTATTATLDRPDSPRVARALDGRAQFSRTWPRPQGGGVSQA